MKKILYVFSLLLLVSGCGSCPYMKERVDYKCGKDDVWVKYMKDHSALVLVEGEKHPLYEIIDAKTDLKYANTSRGIEFWKQGEDDYRLRVGKKVYPSCTVVRVSN